MATTRRYRDRADDSLLTLLGEIPELIRNLVIAEVDAGKKWVARAVEDGKWGAIWIALALFVLFWAIPAFLAFAIIGLSSWWPAWVASLVVFVLLIVMVAVFGLLGVLRFRSLAQRENPVESIVQDVREVRDEF